MLDVLVDDAHRFLAAQIVVQEFGGHIVLDDLVLEDAEARLLDRHTGQFAGRAHPGPHHRLDDRVDLLLVKLAEGAGRLSGGINNGVDFGGA